MRNLSVKSVTTSIYTGYRESTKELISIIEKLSHYVFDSFNGINIKEGKGGVVHNNRDNKNQKDDELKY